MKVRINKYLADQGICSRRKADEHILRGDVLVNGKVAIPGTKIISDKDEVIFRGKKITTLNSQELEYWALYKPRGVVSTASDEKGRKNVVDLINTKSRIYPVGRLDTDSEGLIILTNDGDFANRLSHPSFQHVKSYKVIAKGIDSVDLQDIKRKLERGFLINGKKMRALRVVSIDRADNHLIEIELDLITGYNRQIRRMCDKIGLKVIKLMRTGISKLKLSDLKLSAGQSVPIGRDQVI